MVLGISAVMLWQITAIAAGVGAVFFLATRHAIWAVAVVLLTLNGLTIGTGQTIGQIVLCLVLSILLVGTHIVRRRPDIVPALRARRWRRLMTIE